MKDKQILYLFKEKKTARKYLSSILAFFETIVSIKRKSMITINVPGIAGYE